MNILSHAGFIAVAEEAIDILKKLSGSYPHLVSPYVEVAIDNWEKHRHSTQAATDLKRAEEQALSRVASALIETHQMEDVLQLLSAEFSLEIDYEYLISLVGRKRYISALRREADELMSNSISLEQMAQLWNSMGKPVLGGGRWTASNVSMITE